MPQNYSVFAPNRGTIMVAWSSEYQPSVAEVRALEAAALIPGVRLQERSLDIAMNACLLREVLSVYRVCGVDPLRVIDLYEATFDQSEAEHLWEPKRAPYAYQAEAALDIVQCKKKLVSFDMGLGKTGITIQAAETVRLRARNNAPVVIVAPLFTRATWRNELVAMGAVESREEVCCLTSRDISDGSWSPQAKYIFVHYDVVFAWWSKINLRRPCFVIVDEGHWIKNGRAARSSGTMMVAGTAPYCAILTATPMTNRPSELWHLLAVLTNPYAFGSPKDFRIRYAGAIFNGHGYQDAGPTHVEELRARIKNLYVRKVAKDVALELPPLTRVFHEIDPDAPLSRHEAMSTAEMASLVAAVKDGGVAKVLELLCELRKETSALKLAHTIEYATNAIEQGEKVVIFTWQRATAKKITNKLMKKFVVHCVTGEDDLDDRENAVAAFQAGTGDAIVATLGALKEGVTLHAARIVILHDLDWVPAALRQAERRILRIGQERPCISVWMMCKKSVDMIFAAMLTRKLEDISETLGEVIEGFEDLNAIVHRESDDLREKQIQDWLNW